MAKLADAQALGACEMKSRAGSSPVAGRKKEIIDIVTSSLTMRSARVVLANRGIVLSGREFRRITKQLNIYKPNQSGKGLKRHTVSRSLEKILVVGTKYNSNRLRKRLLKENVFEHKCYRCNFTHWFGEKIPLELDHINGDHHDNRLENLKLLCPNCHAQTPYYCKRKT